MKSEKAFNFVKSLENISFFEEIIALHCDDSFPSIYNPKETMSYTIPLPVLKDYDLSEKTGFLPENLPVKRLPSYYDSWENTVTVLPALLITKRIRDVVDKFQLLDTKHLETEEQYRRAYSILGFLGHAYIWGVDIPTNRLPVQIAQPWVEISNHLRIPPIATYAGLCLWNWQEILPINNDSKDYEDDDEFLDNLRTINTFTGSIDEQWFYLVSVYFEFRCAPCITTGLDAIKFAREGNTEKVIECLKKLAESIDYLGSVLMKMEEMCDPHVFYFRLRPYLAGWKNMENAGLPNGVYYGNEKEPRILSGGSNAQSSSIQTLDLLLNVDHTATGESHSGKANPFMSEMRKYMPGKHADFLEHLSKVNILRDYVTKNALKSPELVLAYDASVAMLKTFRDKHIRIVTRYIVIQAQKEHNMGSANVQKNTLRAGLAKVDNSKKDNVLRGTGGTALLPFLKQCRDETGNTAAGSWGKRILSVKESTTEPKVEEKFKLETTDSKKTEKSFSLSNDVATGAHLKNQGSW
jgi:indoleamine 2,3-dioxygenase